eukprot:CFRG5960T1
MFKQLLSIRSQSLMRRYCTSPTRVLGASTNMSCTRSYTTVEDEPSANSWSLVVTISGKDRVGVVGALTKRLTQYDGNVIKSKMARLAGEFAVVAHVDLEKPYNPDLLVLLHNDFPDYAVSVHKASQQPDHTEIMKTYMCTVEGPSQSNTLTVLAAKFAELGCNIDDLESEVVHAPFAGYKVLKAKACISFPAEEEAHIKQTLHAMGEHHTLLIVMTDITNRVEEMDAVHLED